jgi:hypothetical protein
MAVPPVPAVVAPGIAGQQLAHESRKALRTTAQQDMGWSSGTMHGRRSPNAATAPRGAG